MEQLADLVVELGRVAHVRFGVDGVVVSSAFALAGDEPVFDEVGDDALSGAFGDPHCGGDVAEPCFGVAGDAEQNLGVVGEERPAFGLIVA